jgi:uncharacterized protein (TIGR02646 family)
MRPVDKGENNDVFVEPGDAQRPLTDRLGRFCSYCGRHIAASIHVEHKRPEILYPLERLLWANFLLACSNCNSAKSRARVVLDNYLWPDTDNTLRAFRYLEGGLIRVNRRLPGRVRRKAARTLFLLGLDKVPNGYREPTDRDYRIEDRRLEWDKAHILRAQLRANDNPIQRGQIEILARNGNFSVWMEVFSGDADIRRRLINLFPNTAENCFNADTTCASRPGGQV